MQKISQFLRAFPDRNSQQMEKETNGRKIFYWTFSSWVQKYLTVHNIAIKWNQNTKHSRRIKNSLTFWEKIVAKIPL